MDATKLIFEDNFFDVVVSYGVIEHVQYPQETISEAYRVLKNKGLFLFMIPSLDYYRTDREDEGWYEDLDSNRQQQWNYFRNTWEEIFTKTPLIDIWNSPKRREWLKYHIEGRRDRVPLCSYCEFWGVPTGY